MWSKCANSIKFKMYKKYKQFYILFSWIIWPPFQGWLPPGYLNCPDFIRKTFFSLNYFILTRFYRKHCFKCALLPYVCTLNTLNGAEGQSHLKVCILTLSFSFKCLKNGQIQAWKVAFMWTFQLTSHDVFFKLHM